MFYDDIIFVNSAIPSQYEYEDSDGDFEMLDEGKKIVTAYLSHTSYHITYFSFIIQILT